MKCVACGKELTEKETLYSEDKQPYCSNPFTCSDDHPNSVKNIVARAAAVRMYTLNELEDKVFEDLDVSPEMRERIIRVATKPQSIRMSKPDIAYYIIDLQERKDLVSISEAVRYCIQLAMKIDPMPTKQPTGESSEPVQQEGIKFVVPDIPKSVNVDWSKIKAEPKQEETNTEEDEKFVF